MLEHQLDDADVDAVREQPARAFVPEIAPPRTRFLAIGPYT